MGMGEPLHNYDAVMKATDILRDPSGLSLAADRITLSTVGVVPGIRRMADEASPIHLAVSLHAANQEERAALVPAARKWPLDELMDACRHFCDTLKRRIFFEWTLIEGRNDSERHAHAVGRLIARASRAGEPDPPKPHARLRRRSRRGARPPSASRGSWRTITACRARCASGAASTSPRAAASWPPSRTLPRGPGSSASRFPSRPGSGPRWRSSRGPRARPGGSGSPARCSRGRARAARR
jgi:hypothetical protein